MTSSPTALAGKSTLSGIALESRNANKRSVKSESVYDKTQRETSDKATRTASGRCMAPDIAPEFTVDGDAKEGSDAVEEGSVETGLGITVGLEDIKVVKPEDAAVGDADDEGDGSEEMLGDADEGGVLDAVAVDEGDGDADLDAEPAFRVELAPTVMVNKVVLGVEEAVIAVAEAGTGMGVVAAGRGVSNEPDMPTSLKLADHAVYGAVPLSFFSDADAIATKYLSESGPAAALGMNVMDLLALTSTGGMLCTSFCFASSASLHSSELCTHLLPCVQSDSRPANCR